MLVLVETWESIRDFVATGGDVLYVVAIALFLMWVLMIERYVPTRRVSENESGYRSEVGRPPRHYVLVRTQNPRCMDF